MPSGLLTQVLGPGPAFRHSQEAGISQFTAGRVFLHALSGLVAAPLNIEQIIGDLKSLAETAPVAVQTLQQFRVRSGRFFSQGGPNPEPQTGPKHGAGLAGMDVLQSLQGVGEWESGRVG